jgi:diguanylate cyclase (GGDEF)-like protein/PAS domain S-box-containing protein
MPKQNGKSFFARLDYDTGRNLAIGASVLVFMAGLLAICIPLPLVGVLLVLAAAPLPWLIAFWLGAPLREMQRLLEKEKQTGRRARKRIDYLESILQDSSDIIFTVDTEGFILKFNKGSEIHFGYSQEEIVGKPLGQLFVNEADERKILCEVLLAGKSINAEVPMKTRDAEIILLNLSMSEMKSEAGDIIGLVATAKDITEKKKLELELRRKNELLSKLAITDSLTELYNLRHFYDQMTREFRRMRRNPERRMSLIMMDIDHFKDLNDSEGHQVGDQVLKALAQVIKVCIRKDVDAGFRYGGDEFVIMLPDTDKNQARVAAQRIQKQFGAFKFGKTSLSIGITEAYPEEEVREVVRRADEAMYDSKRAGRARITLA